MATVTAAQLKNVIGEVLNQVQFRHERVMLTRKGEPAAAIIPVFLRSSSRWSAVRLM